MIWDVIEDESSVFDKHFEDVEKLTIEDLLLDQNIITEFKNLNPKLIDFLTEHKAEFINKLIMYVTVMPDPNDSEDRIKKLPYVSSEVLSIDNAFIYNELLGIKEAEESKKQNSENAPQHQIDNFSNLVQTFNTASAENQILMGYFLKVLQNLYKCDKRKTAEKIYQHREVFLKHLDKECIGTILKLPLVLLDTPQGFLLTERKQLIEKVIEVFVAEDSSQEVRKVCGSILNEVIQKFQTFSSGDQLLSLILKSELFLKMFSIQNGPVISEFLAAYLTKSLQKIAGENDKPKSIIQIPKEHKQGIRKYIIDAKILMFEDKTEQQKILNQSQVKVIKVKKHLVNFIHLIGLALQNGILECLNVSDIQFLWLLVKRHPYNDILKAKVFHTFQLIIRKDAQLRQVFLEGYWENSIQLFESQKALFGYHLFELNTFVAKKSKPNLKPELNERWIKLEEYFQKNQSYKEMAQKVIDTYSSTTKVHQLVVDEEDAAPSSGKAQSELNQEALEAKNQQSDHLQDNKQSKDQSADLNKEEGKDEKPSEYQSSASSIGKEDNSSKSQNKSIHDDPFAAFQSFGSNSSKKQEKKSQSDKKGGFDDFADFSSFM